MEETREKALAEDKDNIKARAYLDNLLVNGSNESIDDEKRDLPSWYNEKLFKEGQASMKKYRFVLISGMLAGLVAVLAIPSILKILICTRKSNTPALAYKRYFRTIYHILAWYENSVESGSNFWKSISMVRKAHSQSSRKCSKVNVGQITQKDLALTQFGFIGFITLGAERIGLYDDEFLEASSHMWRVIGYLLGIKDEYNICGATWAETKIRMEIVMTDVYQPALENANYEFYEMTKTLIEGISVFKMISVGSFLFFTKRLSYCRGYEYYDFDYRNGERNSDQKLHYYDLGIWDRIIVSYGLFLVTYLHKYVIFRLYLNFRMRLMLLYLYYWQFIPFSKFKIGYIF